MNQQMFNEGHNDYLLMLNSPDYGNLASPQKPHYVNDVRFSELNEEGEASGYLCMKPSADIFSPRTEEEKKVFDFDLNKKDKLNGEHATQFELLPILHTNDSDSELSPTVPKSFSNPTYQKGLAINDGINTNNIVKTSDNYINMPQQKVLMKNDKKPMSEVNNSTKLNDNIINDDMNNRHYVNSQSRDWERHF